MDNPFVSVTALSLQAGPILDRPIGSFATNAALDFLRHWFETGKGDLQTVQSAIRLIRESRSQS